jgi:hypothetical protein
MHLTCNRLGSPQRIVAHGRRGRKSVDERGFILGTKHSPRPDGTPSTTLIERLPAAFRKHSGGLDDGRCTETCLGANLGQGPPGQAHFDRAASTLDE